MERNEKDEKSFVCRVCGHKKYEEKFAEPIVCGGGNVVEYCFCSNCTALFVNPKSFSNWKKNKVKNKKKNNP